jgi:hypothetical protein
MIILMMGCDGSGVMPYAMSEFKVHGDDADSPNSGSNDSNSSFPTSGRYR